MKRKTRLISILTLLCVLIISLVSCLCLLTACSDSEPEGESVKREDGALADLATTDHGSIYTKISTLISGSHYDSATKTLTITSDTRYVYMDEDCTCNIVIEEGAGCLLCLHGHTLTGAGGASVITLKEGAGCLLMTDCDSDHKGKVTGGSGNTITKDGYSYTAGGAICVEGSMMAGNDVQIYGGTITGNSANIGGAIYVKDADVKVFQNAVITDNTASYSGSGKNGGKGGAIYAENSAVSIYNKDTSSYVGGVVSNNTATATGNSELYSGGGGIYAEDCDVSISDGAIISGNEATGYYGGGGLCLDGTSTLTMTGGEISGNTSLGGGGIIADGTDSVLDITGGVISGNDASAYLGGGGIMCGGDVRLSNVEITENMGAYGGGIYVGGGSVEMGDGTVISGNEAVYSGSYNYTADMGGGVFVRAQSGDVTISIASGAEISNNAADTGGGVYVNGDTAFNTHITLSGGKIDYNTARSDGGGVYLKGNATFTMNSGSVSYNEAAGVNGNGGGLYLLDYSSYSPVATINGGDVSHNKTHKYGAGVYLNSSATFTLAGGHIDYNEMSSGWSDYTQGGGVYMVSETSFVMSSGSISYNKSSTFTGGVNICSNASFTMTGGEIVGNMACMYGGVSVSSSATFTVSGKIVIDGNYDCELDYGSGASCFPSKADDLTSDTCYSPSDVNVSANGAITLGGALSSGSSIGIQYNNQGGANEEYVYTQITASESSTKYYQSSYQYFFLDYEGLADKYSFYADTSNKCVSLFDNSSYETYTVSTSGDVTYYSTFSDGLAAAEDNKSVSYTLYLNKDITSFTASIGGAESYISVYGTFVLDLNGHTIYSTGKGRILGVRGGKCTILDSKDSYGVLKNGTDDDIGTFSNGDGTYTTVYKAYDEDGKAYYGTYTAGALTGVDIHNGYGALFVYSGGTLDMYGGIVCGNKTMRGGGVCVTGSSSASSDPAYFYMYGGAISDNYSYDYGGGVDLGNVGYGSIFGGIISDNYATTYGGGISLKNASGYSGILLLGVQENEDIEVGCDLVISSNVAAGGNGGGVYVGYRTVYLYSGDIVDNIAYEGDGGGLYVDGNGSYYGTLHLDGGRVMYNSIVSTSSYKYGGGVYNTGRLYIDGDAYVYYNKYYLSYYGGSNNYYANIYNESSTKLYIDAGFCGYIGVLDSTIVGGGSSSQLSTKSSTAYSYDILNCISIDNNRGVCVGIVDDYYIWIYVSHDDSNAEWNTIEWDGSRYVYYQRCSQCHEILDYSTDLSYSNPSGVLTASYNGISVEVEHGFIEYRSNHYYWYATVEEAMEAATTNSIIYLCEDAGDFEISNSHVVWIVLYGNSAGTITVSDGLAVQISYDGYVRVLELEDGASVTLDAGTYGTSILDNEAITISTNAVLVTKDGNYVVTNAETAKLTAVASVTVGDLTVYFEDFDDALEYLDAHSAEGVTLTLYADADANISLAAEDNFTIDLNGYELKGSVTIANGATLTVTGEGSVDAAFDVDESGCLIIAADEDGIEITLGDDSTFAGEMDITSGTVEIDLNGNELGTLAVGDGDEGTFANVTIADSSEGNSGTINNIDTSNMGEGDSLVFEGGSYSADQVVQIYENLDAGYAIKYDPEANGGEGAFAVVEMSVTSDCEVSLTYTVKDSEDNEQEITIYFDDIEDAVKYAETLADEDIEVKITLQQDISDCDIDITTDNITIDLGGNTFAGDISIEDGAVLTVTGEGSVDATFDVADSGKLIIAADENGDGIYVKLESDDDSSFEGEMEITSGDVTVDLNGNELGALVVGDDNTETSANVTIVDSGDNSGTIDKIDASNMGEGDSLAFEGGSYSESQIGQVYENLDTADYAIIFDSDANGGDGAYAVVSKDEAEEKAVAYVAVKTEDGETTVYFDDISKAVEFAEKMSQESGTSSTTITLLEDVEGGMEIDNGEITVDLNGHSVDELTVGDGETGTVAEVTIVDSSENKSGSVANLDTDNLDTTSGESLVIEGGTFSQDISDYVDTNESFVVIRGSDDEGNETYFVVNSDNVNIGDYAAASVVINGKEYYFESVEAAIKYIEDEENEIEQATIKLLADTEMSGEASSISSSSITIDLNGHVLDANISISADSESEPGEGGSLKVMDSGEGSGSITGTITVTGTSQDEEVDNPSEQQNTYEETLVFEGVGRGENLTIDLDGLTSSQSENVDYQFGMTGDGTYGIVVGHEHVYNIEVWERQSDGSYTLRFMCACGLFERYCIAVDNDGVVCQCSDNNCTCNSGECNCDDDCACRRAREYTNIKPTYTVNSDGTVTVSVEITISFDESDSRSETYTEGKVSSSETFVPAAYVQTGDGEEDKIYFESVDDALAYAGTASESVTIVLMGDAEAEIEITGSNVSIDLNGYELSGDISIVDGSTLTITGSGDLDAVFDVAESGKLIIEADEGGEGINVTLEDGSEFSGEMDVTSGDVTVDLNGNELGNLAVGDGEDEISANVTVLDSSDGNSGTIDNIVTTSMGAGDSLAFEGGSYSESQIGQVYDNLDNEKYVIQYVPSDTVGEDGSYAVVEKSEAENSAQAYVTVETAEGTTTVVYFENIDDAVSYAEEMSKGGAESVKITLESDVEEMTIANGEIEVDLAGNDIGTLAVGNEDNSTTAKVTVTDSSSDNLGSIGSIVVSQAEEQEDESQNTLDIKGGSYSAENIEDVSANLADGSALYYDPDTQSYEVVDESSVTNAKVSLTYSTEDEQDITIYFDDIADAVNYAESLVDETSESPAVTITLLDDIEECEIEISSNNITIDLGGNELGGSITIDNDSTLTVTGEGSVDAAFDVADSGKLVIEADDGEIEITLGEDSSFEGEMNITSGDVTVDLNGNDIGTLVVGDGEEGTSANVTIKDSGENGSGSVGDFSVAEDGRDGVTIEGGTFSNDISEYLEDNFAAVKGTDENGDDTYRVIDLESVDLSDYAAATVTIDEEPNEKIYYFESFDEALKFANEHGGTLTLWQDVEPGDIEICGSFTLDLNGNTLTADVSVGEGGNLTITDTSETDIFECEGAVAGHIECEDGGELSIQAGTYSEDVSEYLDDEVELYLLVGEDENGNVIYSVASNLDGALVKIEDEDGNVRYYSSASAAFSAASDGDTITLLQDIAFGDDETLTLSANGNVTLDLNGQTIEGVLQIGEGSQSLILTVTDLSKDGSGAVEGELSTGRNSMATLAGGTYKEDPRGDGISVEDGYVVVCTEIGDYAVRSEEAANESCAACVTVVITTVVDEGVDENGDPTYVYSSVTETLYFETLSDAIKYAQSSSSDDAEVTLTLLSDADSVEITEGDIILDLNGNNVGVIAIGDEEASTSAHVVVTDSSESKGTVESVSLTQATGQVEENTLVLEGGAYSELDEVLEYIDDEDFAVVDDGERYIVVDREDIGSVAEAMVVTDDGTEVYFANLADAVDYAVKNGVSVTLLSDVEIDGTLSVSGDVSIDLNGHTIIGEIEIDAASGSLTVTDGEGGGSIEGKIFVTDSTEPESGEYSETLVFEGGVMPNADLEIDLSGLGTDGEGNADYVFSKGEDGTYSIVSRADHTEHTYEIDVWNRDGAYVSMALKCACGEYLTDANGEVTEYAADVTYTENEDEGTYTLNAEVTVEGVTYTYSETFVAVASVTATVDGKRTTAYFDDFESALEYAAANGGYMTLLDDYEGDIEIGSGNMSLDLNGHTLSGSITVGDGDETTSAALTILDTSYNSSGLVTGEMSVATEGTDRIILSGGTYSQDISDDGSIETAKGSYVFVGKDEDGNTVYSVMDSDSADDMAQAAVTVEYEDGSSNTVYFEDIEAAIEYAQEMAAESDVESVTLALYDDIEKIEIDDGNIDLDLNGRSVDELVVGDDNNSTSANVTVKDTSESGAGYVGDIAVNQAADQAEDNSIVIEGGTYGVNILETEGANVGEDSFVVVGEDEGGNLVYAVTDEGTAETMAAASVTYTDESGEHTVYFEDIDDAVAFAQDLSSEDDVEDVTVTLWADVDSVEIADGDIDLDLNGHSVGELIIGDDDPETSANVTVKDSSSDNSGYVGTITNEEENSSDEKINSVTIEAGTFGENVEEYLAEDSIMVRSGEDDAVFIVASGDEIGNFAEAFVSTTDGDIYFASLEDAIEYAIENDLTVSLVSDAALSMTIADEVTIDLNGHALEADIEVDAAAGGKLAITDGDEGGKVTGEIRVTDSTFTEAEYDDEGNVTNTVDWSSALVFEGGVEPNPELAIDLEGLGTDPMRENLYVFEQTTNENGDTIYVVSAAASHEHSYSIEIWTLDGDKVTLRLMCACGEYYVNDSGESEFAASVTFEQGQDGAITATASVVANGETHEYGYSFEAAASVAVQNSDGTTSEVFFESLQDAINYAQSCGGTVTLLEDTDDIIFTTEDVAIDLNGHALSGDLAVESGTTTIIDSTGSLVMDCDVTVETGATLVIGDEETKVDISGSITIEEGAEVSVTGSGEISSSLDVDGTLAVSGCGDGMTLNISEDTTLEGTLSLEGDVTLALGGNDLDAAIEIADGSDITLDGQGGTITLEEDLVTSGTAITVTSDTTIDLAGNELSAQSETVGVGEEATEVGGIYVESGTLAVVDGIYGGDIAGNITVAADAEVNISDDAISGYGENYTVSFEDDNYLLASGMDSFGNIYYETVTQAEHALSGCNYDFVTDATLDAETCTLTITFTCLCGESWSEDFVIDRDSYNAYAGEDESGDAAVVVDVDAFVTVSNPVSGVTYTHEILLTDYLPMYTEGAGDEEGYEDPYYSYIYKPATCEVTGCHEYVYNKGDGVVVTVEIPKTHNATYHEYKYELRGETYVYGYYICETCGHIIFSTGEYDGDENGVYETDDMLNYGSIEDYIEDMNNYVAFEEAKDELLESVEESMTGHMGAIGSVQQSYDKLIEDLDGTEYEWQTGTSDERSDYMEQALADLEAMIAEVQFQIDSGVMQNTLNEEIENAYRQMAESGLYEGEALAALNEAYQELLDGVANMKLSVGDDLDEIAERYLRKIYEILYKIRLNTLSALSDEGEMLGEISSESGFDGDTTFVITEIGTFDLDLILSDFAFVSMETGETLTDEEIEALFGGMSVLAGYSISIFSGDMEISVYSGVYTIRIAMPDDVLYSGDLTIVYVGNDGTVEVYAADVVDGYIVFETTHFSDYYIIGERVGDYGSAMTFLGIVLIIELLLAGILLGVYIAKRGRTTRAKVLWTLLYALVAAAGIALAISVMALYVSVSAVITFAILVAAMLVADVMLLYFAFEEPAEQTEGLGQEA